MISEHDLIENPEQFQPLGSVKSIINRPFPIQFDRLDLYPLFISDFNTELLSNNLFKIHQQNGGQSNCDKFIKLVPKLMEEFMKNRNLNDYDNVETPATTFKDWAQILHTINYDFIKFSYKYFKWNEFNPFQNKIQVGKSGERKYKKMYELMPDDHGTIDVWREKSIIFKNENFRNNNRLPAYQTTLHTRHYDLSNEGLRDGSNSDRASLENFQRGFNMNTVYDQIDNYRDSDWWGN
jgi:hypothetical protein